jgi:hypothetical protein
MIDKTMNCTAPEGQSSIDPVYGDYIDGMASIVFSECTDLSGMEVFKVTILPFDGAIVVRK